jgi:AraC family transcriptional regulator
MSIKPLIGAGKLRARGDQAMALHDVSLLDGRVRFDNRQWRCAFAELTWTAPHHVLILTEQGGTGQTAVRAGGTPAFNGRDRPGVLTFVPAEAERQCRYEDADLIYTALWVDPALTAGMTADLPVLVNRDDPVIRTLLTTLRTEIAHDVLPDSAYLEHLIAISWLRLAALDGRRPQRGRVTRRLGREALRQVRDHVEANLDGQIRLLDLARLLDMPTDAFIRRFRSTTGLSPYAYVIERRVRCAEELLRSTALEIGVIATRLGFSSQSHLTSTFRKVTGTTPRAYRAQFLA